MDFTYEKDMVSISDYELYESSREYLDSINEDTIKQARDVAFHLERFSMNFICLLCDEELGFSNIGKKYIEIFKNVVFIIATSVKDESCNFDKSIELYNRWNTKIQKEETRKTIQENKKKMYELDKMSKESLRPIGRK